ncbi:hypothetical protein STPYR_10634 [uncultured Stenotrophomonas sp.]|uniref:Uncharacterized protein n=1 Tax=uncultured Stenotrophomonas sp. TaxID=165438 RepID=A0A1Y5Q7Z8_9GAMM|nr:hypothetical protein STPYR_10634 [uncultured Stenotrophomonas sp.]
MPGGLHEANAGASFARDASRHYRRAKLAPTPQAPGLPVQGLCWESLMRGKPCIYGISVSAKFPVGADRWSAHSRLPGQRSGTTKTDKADCRRCRACPEGEEQMKRSEA